MADYLNIAGRVRTTASDGVAMEAQEVKDLNQNKSQQDINADVQTELGDRYTKEETYSKEQLNELITTPDVNYVSVVATNATTAVTDLLPATGSSDTLYNVGNWNGTQYDTTVYSIYGWDGTAYVCLAVRSSIGEVYDISANHPDGQGNPTPYADLVAALGTDGANIPADIRRGGMSIKFIQGTVQSSDNKYVQYRLMAQNFTTDVTQWQGVDEKLTFNSHNLIESGEVADYLSIKTQQVLSPILSGNYIINNGTLANLESAIIYSLNVEDIEYVEISMSHTLNLEPWAKYAFYNTTVENEFNADHLVGINTGLVSPYSIFQKVPNGAKMLLINALKYSLVPVVKSVRLSKMSEYVSYDETQDKNSTQKNMARKNIGIESLDSELNFNSNGIPTTQAVAKMFEVEKAQQTTALGTIHQYINANGNLQANNSFAAYKLDVSEMEKIHIKFDKNYDVISMKYAFYSTDVEANFGSSTLKGIGTKINGPYDEENIIVPQGSVTLVVIGVYSDKPFVFEYKIEPISNKELFTGMAVTVVSNENKISVGYKYNDNNDLLIHFQPCMFNDLMTFYEVGLSSNADDKPLSTPERTIEKMLNRSSSDNIGPVAVTGGTVGGNHSLNNDGVTKTAKMDAYEVFVDGAKVSDFSGYADCVVIKVINTIYDPTSQVVDHILTTPLIKEMVLYKIENGDISVLVKHKYVGSTIVSYYAGMQSMFVSDYVMTENGAYDDDWTANGNINSFTKSDYPDFNAFFCKNSNGNQTAWLDTSFGIGDHSMLNDADAIFTRNAGKLYHRLIWNKSITAGTTLKWRGIYSWRTPVRYFYETDFLP